MRSTDLPRIYELAWPVLQTVDDLGGSASIGEIVEAVTAREKFTDEQQALMHKDGPQTELAYRLGWSRTVLKATGLLTNSSRGIWSLSDTARALLNDPLLTIEQRGEQVDKRLAGYSSDLRAARRAGRDTVGAVDDADESGFGDAKPGSGLEAAAPRAPSRHGA
jgi:restriction endonuclease Mrr